MLESKIRHAPTVLMDFAVPTTTIGASLAIRETSRLPMYGTKFGLLRHPKRHMSKAMATARIKPNTPRIYNEHWTPKTEALFPAGLKSVLSTPGRFSEKPEHGRNPSSIGRPEVKLHSRLD